MGKIRTRYFSATTETGYEFFTHIAQNHTADPHLHDYVEIVLALNGEMHTTINDTPYDLPDKSLVFLRPQDAHFYVGSGEAVHRDFCFTTKLFKYGCDFLSKRFFPAYINSPDPFIVTVSDSEMVMLETMSQAISLGIDIKMKDVSAKIKILLVNLVNILIKGQNKITLSNVVPPPKPIEELLFKLEINGNISSKTLDEILDEMHYNKAYLRRLFKQYMHVDLNRFWLEKKLTRAATLLKNSNLTAQQIALTCGFDSYAYFNKTFTQKYGSTPYKFKKLLSIPQPPLDNALNEE